MKHSESGLTLLELVMALAVLAVVVGLATPSLGAAIESGRYASASHQISGSLATARMLAITRGHRVAVCPTTDGSSCSDGSDWSRGWLLFLDADRTGQPRDAAAVLEVVERPASGSALRVGTTPGRRLVRFFPNGMAGGNNLTLSICSASGEQLLGQVVVAVSGRARTTRIASGSDVPCPIGRPAG